MHFALCNALNDSDPDRLYLFSLESSRRVALPPRCLCSSQRRRSSRFSSLFLRLFLLSAGHEKNGIRWLEEGRSRRRRRRQQRRRRCFYSSAGWDPPLSLACCQCRWQPLSPSLAMLHLWLCATGWLTASVAPRRGVRHVAGDARCVACSVQCVWDEKGCAGCVGCAHTCGWQFFLFYATSHAAHAVRCTLHEPSTLGCIGQLGKRKA